MRRGIFTVEVGLGAMFLMMTMLPALGLIRTGVRGTAESLHLTRALQTARTCLDAAAALGHDELTDDTLAAVANQLPVPPGVARPRADPLEIVTEKLPDGTFYRAKLITVRVAWTRAEGSTEQGEVVLHGVSSYAH